MQTLLVAGGAGFIGTNFILQARKERWDKIVNLDKLTYPNNLQTLPGFLTKLEETGVKNCQNVYCATITAV